MANHDPEAGAGTVPKSSMPITLFYLLSKTPLPIKFSKNEAVKAHDIVNEEEIVINLPPEASVEDPLCLLTFGTDPQKCDVVLQAEGVKPVHCKVWAQLNSGVHILVVDDKSGVGTQYWDAQAINKKTTRTVINDTRAVEDLWGLRVGPYYFTVRYPKREQEILDLERWTHRHEPIPVTLKMLDHQCSGIRPTFDTLERIGRGGNGTVRRCMAKKCGLMIAVKQVGFTSTEHQNAVFKEIMFMRSLNHHHLVGFLFHEPHSSSVLIAMPLYQGSLLAIMPISDMTVLEQVMMQVMTGVLFMHQKGILHRDIKPDNIFVARKTPIHAVLADLGWAATLDDEYALRRPCGTVGFNAPEIPEQGASDTLQTTAIDVFSLGATFFFMIEPDQYKDATFVAALANIPSRPPRFYAGLVSNMMAPNPQDRPSLEVCLDVVNRKMYTWTKESRPVERTSIRRSIHQEAVPETRLTSLRIRRIASPPLRIPTADIAAVQDPTRLSPAALMEKIIKPKTMQPPQSPATQLVKPEVFRRPPTPGPVCLVDRDSKPPSYKTATKYTPNRNRRPKAERVAVNLERQAKPTEAATNRVADAAAQRTHGTQKHAKPPRDRSGVPAPQAKEAKKDKNVVKKAPTADEAPCQQRAPVATRPSPRTQQVKRKGRHSRQTLASTHEPLRTTIGKLNHNLDDRLHRRIRRHPARERLIYNHAQIKKRAKQLLRGLWHTCTGVADTVVAVADMIVGGVGLPLAVGETVFNIYRANRALNGMTYDTAGFGCNPDGRLIYGLHSRALKPLSITGYKAERVRSFQTWPESDEASCFSNRTRNFVAEHRATHPQEYWETIEGKRVAAKAKRLEDIAEEPAGDEVV